MIFDGYSRHISLSVWGKVLNVWYRPAIKRERDGFCNLIAELGQESAEREIYRFVGRHIVASDITFEQPVDVAYAMRMLDGRSAEAFSLLWQATNGSVEDSSGTIWQQVERDWQQNLYDGVLLERTNPKLAKRSCVDCKRFWFRESDGEIIRSNSTGEPMLREGMTMCETEAGCLKGTPEKQKSLSKQNRWAYLHYQECKAIGSFPDDAIVRSNAMVIERAIAQSVRVHK